MTIEAVSKPNFLFKQANTHFLIEFFSSCVIGSKPTVTLCVADSSSGEVVTGEEVIRCWQGCQRLVCG